MGRQAAPSRHCIGGRIGTASGSGHAATAFNHVATEYATHEAWQQIVFLTRRGVALHRHVERGVTHSIHLTDTNGYEIELVYERTLEPWENDIERALNYAVLR